MVGRILSRLRRQGKLGPASLKDPCIVSRPQVRPYAVRKPKDYVVKAPGDLVQVDSADVRWTGITMPTSTSRRLFAGYRNRRVATAIAGLSQRAGQEVLPQAAEPRPEGRARIGCERRGSRQK